MSCQRSHQPLFIYKGQSDSWARRDGPGSPSSLLAAGLPWCLSACQQPVPQLSPSAHHFPGWLGGPAGFGESGHKARQDERPQKRSEETKILGKCIKTVLRANSGCGLRVGKKVK